MSRITPGWLARHTPQGPGGRQAALIDIAQDLLLAQLHQRGIFDHLVFKGGTALRKLYAGNAGRFSTDLDFSVRNLDDEPEAVTELLRREIDGRDIDGFRYSVEDHRGRAQVRYETPLGGVGNLTTKLDIGPAPWLPPDERGWVRLPVHAAYNLPPAIPVMSLAENMAEKIARPPQTTPPYLLHHITSPHLYHSQHGGPSPAPFRTTQAAGRRPATPQTSTKTASGYSQSRHPAWTLSAISYGRTTAFWQT